MSPDITASINDSIELQCVAIGHPNPSITWTKNGAILSSESNFITNVSDGHSVYSILTVRNVLVEDMGLYICTARNIAGEDRAYSTLLVNSEWYISYHIFQYFHNNVLCTAAPVLLNNETVTNTTVGTVIVLNCTAMGSPPPRIYWQRYGETLTNATDKRYAIIIGDFFSALIIRNSVIEDSGEYICVAVNKEGDAHQVFVVYVFGNKHTY